MGTTASQPRRAVERPKAESRELRTLTAEQVQALLAATDNVQAQTLYYLAVSTGLREGELLGLQWGDLDWKTGALQVQRQAQRQTGAGVVFTEPKSAAGRRLIVLGQATLTRLRKHNVEQKRARVFIGGRWKEQGLIFTSSIGTPLDARKMSRQFKTTLARAGLPDIRFHDLRHTAATLMLQQGIHPKIVQERLGHSNIGMTLDPIRTWYPRCSRTPPTGSKRCWRRELQ